MYLGGRTEFLLFDSGTQVKLFFTLLTLSKAKSASAPRRVCNKISSPFSNGKKRKLSSKLPKTATTQQPKAGTKSAELAQSVAQGSDILTDRHETVEEPAAIVGEASGASNEGQQNLNVNMNAEDLTKVLTDHTKDLSTHCDKQLSALTKAVETTRLTPTFPSGNSVPLPKFTGDRVLGQL